MSAVLVHHCLYQIRLVAGRSFATGDCSRLFLRMMTLLFKLDLSVLAVISLFAVAIKDAGDFDLQTDTD